MTLVLTSQFSVLLSGIVSLLLVKLNSTFWRTSGCRPGIIHSLSVFLQSCSGNLINSTTSNTIELVLTPQSTFQLHLQMCVFNRHLERWTFLTDASQSLNWPYPNLNSYSCCIPSINKWHLQTPSSSSLKVFLNFSYSLHALYTCLLTDFPNYVFDSSISPLTYCRSQTTTVSYLNNGNPIPSH